MYRLGARDVRFVNTVEAYCLYHGSTRRRLLEALQYALAGNDSTSAYSDTSGIFNKTRTPWYESSIAPSFPWDSPEC